MIDCRFPITGTASATPAGTRYESLVGAISRRTWKDRHSSGCRRRDPAVVPRRPCRPASQAVRRPSPERWNSTEKPGHAEGPHVAIWSDATLRRRQTHIERTKRRGPEQNALHPLHCYCSTYVMCARMAAAPSCPGFAIDHIRGIMAAPAVCGAMRYPSWVRLPAAKPFPVEP
jgi:hypothetical protein